MKNYYAEDEQLIQSVRKLMAGDLDSYYDMYNLSIKYIYKIIYDIVKDYHATEDLVQDTYLTIYNKINTLQDPNKFYAWAGRIATNYTYRYMYNSQRELLTMDSEEDSENFMFDLATQDTEEFIPESVLMNKEKQRLIAEIIDGLSVEQKLCVQYFYYEEMSVKDIAESMGCSTGTIKSRLNYARNAIKAAVISLDENQGTRLYSLSAVPLFYIIFRNAVEQMVFSGAVGAAASTAIGTTSLGAAAVAGQGASMTELTSVVANAVTQETTISEMASTVANATGAAPAGWNASTFAGANTATTAGGSVASKVGGGILSKIGTSLGAKIAVAAVTSGVVITGGVAVYNAVTEDKKPETTPMVIHMESFDNTETVDILDDRFSYEYITVTYNDKEITMGFDGDIYQYGYDHYETVSPELMDLHKGEYEEVIAAEDDELEDIFEKDIEFTIDGEEFVFHVEDVEVELNEANDAANITLTGNCETPDNVEDIYEKYMNAYEEKLAELEDEHGNTDDTLATDGDKENSVQEEKNPNEQAIYDYYMGVLKNMYLNRVDPFGNDLGTNVQSGSEICATEYAIADVDMDGMSELLVRTNPSKEIVYGYNPDTGVVVEESNISSTDCRTTADFTYYDTGFIFRIQTDEVFAYDATTDTYDTSETVFNLASIDQLVYSSSPSSYVDPERKAKEQELLDQYDKDGDGLLWYERMEDDTIEYYDKPEYEARFNEVIQGGNKIDIEYLYIDTVMSQAGSVDEDGEEAGNEATVEKDYYLNVVKDIYLTQKHPIVPNNYVYGAGAWKDIYEYIIYDIDCDGIEELVVRYGIYVNIFEYNSDSGELKEEFGWGAELGTIDSLQFYENGYIVIDDMVVYKYNSDTGVYDYKWSCGDNCDAVDWYQMHEMQDKEDPTALYDIDGDGIIYYMSMEDGSYVYFDNGEFEAKFSEVTDGAKKLELDFIDMSTVVE